jgi:hypothetical protein
MSRTASLLTARTFVLLAFVAQAAAFNAPGATQTFATFGNEQTKALIQSWQPKPLAVGSGSVFLPSSAENMKRFVRARILLEDPSTGCIAAIDDNLCVVLTKFNKAEHQLLLPLWQPDAPVGKTFEHLHKWHHERFGSSQGQPGPRISGKSLEYPEDKDAWTKAVDMDI